MTTAAHRPSPANMPRRPAARPPAKPSAEDGPQPYEARRLTPAEALAPGKLRDRERFRATFQRGLRLSRMNPNARLVGHTLLWYSSHITGRISPNLQPTAEELSYATGLTVGQVQVQMQVLESRGWLYHHTLREGPRAGETTIRLAVPALVLEQIRERTAHAGQPTD